MLSYHAFVRLYGTGDAFVDEENYNEYVHEQEMYNGFRCSDDDAEDDAEEDTDED